MPTTTRSQCRQTELRRQATKVLNTLESQPEINNPEVNKCWSQVEELSREIEKERLTQFVQYLIYFQHLGQQNGGFTQHFIQQLAQNNKDLTQRLVELAQNNKDLTQQLVEIAQNNVHIAQNNVRIAQNNVHIAQNNVQHIAGHNVNIADHNVNIADHNVNIVQSKQKNITEQFEHNQITVQLTQELAQTAQLEWLEQCEWNIQLSCIILITMTAEQLVEQNAFFTRQNAFLTRQNASLTQQNAFLTRQNAFFTRQNAFLTQQNPSFFCSNPKTLKDDNDRAGHSFSNSP